MAIIIVTSDGYPGSVGLNFNDAVAASNATPEADTIRFAPDNI